MSAPSRPRHFNNAQNTVPPEKGHILHEKAALQLNKMTPSTKIDLNHSKIARMDGLDELAKALFPGNRSHQGIFLAIFVELKWAPDQFLPALEPIADKHNFSHRTLETVRAKMRRLGIIDHVSRFSKRTGYRESWTFSRRFERSLTGLAERFAAYKDASRPEHQPKDRDLHHYL